MLQNIKFFCFDKVVLLIIFLISNSLLAQIQNNELFFIGDNTSVYLSSDTFYFGAGLGQTKTTRTPATHGKLVFGSSATWSGASNSHFVDGYVSTKTSTSFIMPIGQSGIYAPAQVIPTTNEGVDGAYFRTNPTTIGATLDAAIRGISSVEYWDIRGTSNTKITLTWRASSGISNLTLYQGTSISSLTNLSIVGFDGTKWVLIPSSIDAISILGGASTLFNGSITSNAGINLNSYSAFSLGSKGSDCMLSCVWDGSTWSPFTPVSSQKAIIAANYSEPTDLTACSLEVTGNAVVTVPSGNDFNISGAINVANTASLTFENNANLLQQGTTNTNSGNVVVKRKSSALMRLDYTLWASPVADQNLLAFSPMTSILPTSRFYTYNSNTNYYNSIASPSTTNFEKTKGYLIRMPNNHPTTPTVWNGQFNGVPNTGNFSVTLNNGGAGYRFNLIGNPYPSPIDATLFYNNNFDGATPRTTGTFYFWRKTNGSSNPSYCTMTIQGGFTSNGQAQVFDSNGIIQTGQGFFVEANENATNLTFNNSMRVGNNANQFFRNNNLEKNRIWLNASNDSGAFSQTMIGYIENATLGIDNAIDGKFINDGDLALASIIDNEHYTIQGRPVPFDQNDTVPLVFKATNAGTFYLSIDHVDGLFSGNQNIFLNDRWTNVIHDLKQSAYPFVSDSGTFNNRFEIVYTSNSLSTHNPTFDTNSVVVYKEEQVLHINSGTMIMSKVKIFDVRGRLLFEKNNINTTTVKLNDLKAVQQIIFVQITSDDNQIVTKKVIY